MSPIRFDSSAGFPPIEPLAPSQHLLDIDLAAAVSFDAHLERARQPAPAPAEDAPSREAPSPSDPPRSASDASEPPKPAPADEEHAEHAETQPNPTERSEAANETPSAGQSDPHEEPRAEQAEDAESKSDDEDPTADTASDDGANAGVSAQAAQHATTGDADESATSAGGEPQDGDDASNPAGPKNAQNSAGAIDAKEGKNAQAAVKTTEGEPADQAETEQSSPSAADVDQAKETQRDPAAEPAPGQEPTGEGKGNQPQPISPELKQSVGDEDGNTGRHQQQGRASGEGVAEGGLKPDREASGRDRSSRWRHKGPPATVSSSEQRVQPAPAARQPAIGVNAAAAIADTSANGNETSTAGAAKDVSAEPVNKPGASSTTDQSPSATQRLAAMLGRRSASPASHQRPGGLTETQRVQFVQRVARAFHAADQRGGTIRLRLSPPDLGSLRLEIGVKDGLMTARLETETHAARNLLLDNLPALRDRLAEQDIKIARFDVDVADQSPGGSPEQTAQHAQSQNHPGGRTPRPQPSSDPDADRPSAAPQPRLAGDSSQLNVIV